MAEPTTVIQSLWVKVSPSLGPRMTTVGAPTTSSPRPTSMVTVVSADSPLSSMAVSVMAWVPPVSSVTGRETTPSTSGVELPSSPSSEEVQATSRVWASC